MNKKRTTLVSALGSQIGNQLADGSAGANIGTVLSLPAAQRVIVEQAYTDSLRSMWILYVCVGAVGLAMSTLITQQHLSQKHEMTQVGLDASKGSSGASREGAEKEAV